MANPFAVDVPQINALQSLMQGYGFTSGIRRGTETDAARKEAQEAILSGGDTRGALARLLGTGDYHGAQVLGSLGKADTTDDIREYNLAKSQGFTGSFRDYQIGMKQAGATRINNQVNTGERAYDQTLGKANAERFLEYQKGGQSAQSALQSLDVLERAMEDPNFYSGPGAERFALPLRQAQAAFGGDPKAAASMETFRATASKAALDAMGGSLGTGFSNADRDFIVNQVPTLGNTPEGNKQLIDVSRKIRKREIEVSKMAREYAAKNGGRLDAGFDAVVSAHAEKNPLFKGAGGGWQDLGNGVRIREKR